MTARNILVVEDNPDIAGLLSLHLGDRGYRVRVGRDGVSGLSMVHADHPDLIILDLMLPKMDGMDVCRRLRSEADYTPILMLTSKSSEADRVQGLDAGADDYLVKPFSIRELLARVNAMLRRRETFNPDTGNAPSRIENGALAMDLDKRGVTIGGRAVDLTVKEFDLLCLLATHPGRVYSRCQLLDLVWGQDSASYEHTVNSHINRLRAKIETDPARPEYVLTVWGLGYKFRDTVLQ